jgi:hypothetical protein
MAARLLPSTRPALRRCRRPAAPPTDDVSAVPHHCHRTGDSGLEPTSPPPRGTGGAHLSASATAAVRASTSAMDRWRVTPDAGVSPTVCDHPVRARADPRQHRVHLSEPRPPR